MRDLAYAVDRLQAIYDVTSPEAVAKAEKEKDWDDFTKLKKKIHADISKIRKLLKERDELTNTASRESAELSFQIRSLLKETREEAGKLQAMQKKEAASSKKKMQSEEITEQHQLRAELVDLIFKHLEECENLVRKRYADKAVNAQFMNATAGGVDKAPASAADRAALLAPPPGSSGTRSSANIKGMNPGDIEMKNVGSSKSGQFDSALPDIDIGEDMLAIQRRNQEIDQDLEEISKGVVALKQIAIGMNEELEKQDQIIDELDTKVNKANRHLDSVNTKLKQAIDGVMKGDRFCVNCILVTILLAIAGFIASFFF